jgi:hypothetical protein
MYYQQHAAILIDNGYAIVPIIIGQKRPALVAWQTNYHDTLDKLNPRFSDHGVGIVTGVGENKVYAIDMDSVHPVVAERFHRLMEQDHPQAICRVGKAPKALYMVRSKLELKKAMSRKFVDAEGREHRLEILGKGQQFVALSIHPDTQKEYQWDEIFGGPVENPVSTLPEIDQDQINELIDAFESICQQEGLQPKGSASKSQIIESAQEDDEFAALMVKENANITDEEVWEHLAYMDANDYDQWLLVGMALHHQYGYGQKDGSAQKEKGFQIWLEWSSEVEKFKGEADLRKRWRGFSSSGSGVTFRSVIHHSNQNRVVTDREEFDNLQAEMTQKIEDCDSYYDLTTNLITEVKEAVIRFPQLLEVLARTMQQRMNTLSNTQHSIATVRKSIKRTTRVPDPSQWDKWAANCPEWARNWVWVAFDKSFVNIRTGLALDPASFRYTYQSELGVQSDTVPEVVSHLLDNDLIPKCHERMYRPGEINGIKIGKLFKENGKRYLNTYRSGGRKIPEVWTEEGRRAADLFRRHIELFCGGWNRDAMILMSWFKYIIQHPGEKIRWAVVLQGDEGDGKSILSKFMAFVLGHENCGITEPDSVINSQYNQYAEGVILQTLEEIRVSGINRYAVLNRLKPLITNDMVDIRNKFEKNRKVRNTVNYLILTNHIDALPVNDADRRYFILFSQFGIRTWERKELKDYFDVLNDQAINVRSEFIAKWLIEEVDYHPEFNINRAPHSRYKDMVAAQSHTTAAELIRDMVEDHHIPGVTRDAIVWKELLRAIRAEDTHIKEPEVKHALNELGYVLHPVRTRVQWLDHPQRVWVQKDYKLDEKENWLDRLNRTSHFDVDEFLNL